MGSVFVFRRPVSHGSAFVPFLIFLDRACILFEVNVY